MMLQVVGASILLLGTLICLVGAIGLLRLPNSLPGHMEPVLRILWVQRFVYLVWL